MHEAAWSDAAILDVLREVLSEVLEKEVPALALDAPLELQLGIDSMGLVEIATCLEDRFDRRMPPLEELVGSARMSTVSDLVKLARRILEEGEPLGLAAASGELSGGAVP